MPSDSPKPLHSQVVTIRKERESKNPGDQFTLQSHSASDSLVSTANLKSVELVELTQGDMKYHVQRLITKDDKITYVIPYHGDGGTNNQQREAEHSKLQAIVQEIQKKEENKDFEIVIPCEANISPYTTNDKGEFIPNPTFTDFLKKVSPDGRSYPTRFEMAERAIDKQRGPIDEKGECRGLSGLSTLAEKTGLKVTDLKSVVLCFSFQKGQLHSPLNKQSVTDKIAQKIETIKENGTLNFRTDKSLLGADHSPATMTTPNGIIIVCAPKISTRNIKGFCPPSEKWKVEALDAKSGDPDDSSTWLLSKEAEDASLASVKEFSRLSVECLRNKVMEKTKEVTHLGCIAAQVLYKFTQGNEELKTQVLRELNLKTSQNVESKSDEDSSEIFKPFFKQCSGKPGIIGILTELDSKLSTNTNLCTLFTRALEEEDAILKAFEVKEANPQASFAKAFTKVRDIFKEMEGGADDFKTLQAKAIHEWTKSGQANALWPLLKTPKSLLKEVKCNTLAEEMFDAKSAMDPFLMISNEQTTAGFESEVSSYKPVDNELMHVMQAVEVVRQLKAAGDKPTYIVNLEGGIFAPDCELYNGNNEDKQSITPANMVTNKGHALVYQNNTLTYVEKLPPALETDTVNENPTSISISQNELTTKDQKDTFEKVKKRIENNPKPLGDSQEDDKIAKAASKLLGISLVCSQPRRFFEYIHLFLNNPVLYEDALKQPDVFTRTVKIFNLNLVLKPDSSDREPKHEELPPSHEIKSRSIPVTQEFMDNYLSTIQYSTKRTDDPEAKTVLSNFRLALAKARKRELTEQDEYDLLLLSMAAAEMYTSKYPLKNSEDKDVNEEKRLDKPYQVVAALDRLSSNPNTSGCAKAFKILCITLIVAALIVVSYALYAEAINLISPTLDLVGLSGTITGALAESTASAMIAFGGGATVLPLAGAASAIVGIVLAKIQYNLFKPATLEVSQTFKNLQKACVLTAEEKEKEKEKKKKEGQNESKSSASSSSDAAAQRSDQESIKIEDCYLTNPEVKTKYDIFVAACRAANPTEAQKADMQILHRSVYDMLVPENEQSLDLKWHDPYEVEGSLERLSAYENTSACAKAFRALYITVIVTAAILVAYALYTGVIALIPQALDLIGLPGTTTGVLAESAASTMIDFAGGGTILSVVAAGAATLAGASLYKLFKPAPPTVSEAFKDLVKEVYTPPQPA